VNAEERLTAYLCSRPGSEALDEHHAEFARQILDQHAQEIVARQSKLRFGLTEGLEVVQLADQLREAATTLAAREDIATTDDPLTLVRCIHETVGALFEIAPAVLTAARLNPEAVTTEDAGVAAIHHNVTQGLARAYNALRDATNCV
jgi:hypothetical protein